MLHLYLDESGDRDDPGLGVVSVGGLLAPVSAWAKFEDAWSAALRRFGVSELHMKDFAHRSGEFVGWSEPQRRALLEILFVLLENETGQFVPIGSARPVVFYRKLEPPLRPTK